MKRLIILLFPLLLVGCTSEDYSYVVKPVDNEVHYDDVYLIMGQSNATGVAEWRFLEEKAPDINSINSIHEVKEEKNNQKIDLDSEGEDEDDFFDDFFDN